MVRLIGNLYVVAGDRLTHPWDASAYLIGGDEPTLIDCGSSAGYPALKRSLQALGYAPRDIRRVIATHSHWDHLSGMALLREESDAALWMHPAERDQVETGDAERTVAFLYGQAFPSVTVDRLLDDGEILRIDGYCFQVLHTPGHSPGSISLWTEINGLKLLIAGDTLWGHYHPRIGSDLDAWCASLDRILELDFDAMSFGHCPPNLSFDAKHKVREARQQLGVYFNPWFKPLHMTFRY
jgi:hydroxyacylglutathione hydrolase